MTTTNQPHDPTEEQKHNLLWMLGADGVALCRMKHKTTGEWRTIIMVAHRPIGTEGAAMTYPVGIMMEANEVRSCLDEYELPSHTRRETEEEMAEKRKMMSERRALVDVDPTEAVLDRVFPNRKKD